MKAEDVPQTAEGDEIEKVEDDADDYVRPELEESGEEEEEEEEKDVFLLTNFLLPPACRLDQQGLCGLREPEHELGGREQLRGENPRASAGASCDSFGEEGRGGL